ncbi:IS701 family transposase [Streptomyces sp. NPDC101151]|uniref:IS701 family transposase n=1 Tax=Streptomyces sp. NPDC101151 TaxID=3366115 RepID=UPI0037F3A581
MTPEQIDAWGEELAEVTGGLAHLFARPEPAEVFADLIEGLLDGLPKKNGWTMSARAGHAGPERIQKFLNAASWDDAALVGAVRDYALARLGDEAAVMVVEDTQSIKKGDKSVGAAFQHCGTTGDVRNCQVMVMLTYAAGAGHTFLDRRLYLPQSWAGDVERREEAGVPAEVGFLTKPRLAALMLADALAAQVPFSWFAADSGYGRDPHLRAYLHAAAIRYVLGVPVDLPLSGVAGKPDLGAPPIARAGDLLHYAISRDRWERRSCGEGTKGQRLYDWTVFEVELAEQAPADGYVHRLLIRRSTKKKHLAGGRFDYDYAYLPGPRADAHPGPGDHPRRRSALADRGRQQGIEAAGGAGGLPGAQVEAVAPLHRLLPARPRLPRRRARRPRHTGARASGDRRRESGGKRPHTGGKDRTGPSRSR